PLLSQVLMAATYPPEVAEAARWSRANPGLQGDDAVRAAQNEDWDSSVKSLVAFPQVLARMEENPGWTRSLGDAFLVQEPHMMDTVQQLRRRAQAAGNLQSSEQMFVQQQGQAILVQPASPQYVYVPYYDPLVVYGPWWWPAYQPVVWAPWRGYARHYRPGVSVGFWWGAPIGLSANFFFGNFDWHHRHVRVAHPSAYYYRQPFAVNRNAVLTPQRWQHEPRRREAFAERRPIQVQQQIQVQPQVQRQERQQVRSQANVLPSIQAQPAAQAPASVQVQPRREERERARIDRRETREAQPQVQLQPRAQPEVRPQPQALPQPVARPQAQVQQPRATTPQAVAPQQPRAERQEQRQERREMRHELRNERGLKGS
ncbi:MAG: DUF3300 domain-containing protein, partial [Pseudomonadota bacterium]